MAYNPSQPYPSDQQMQATWIAPALNPSYLSLFGPHSSSEPIPPTAFGGDADSSYDNSSFGVLPSCASSLETSPLPATPTDDEFDPSFWPHCVSFGTGVTDMPAPSAAEAGCDLDWQLLLS